MTYTYTFALLGVSPAAYDEIRSKMIDAGYEEKIQVDNGGAIDMHGIAIVPDATHEPRSTTVNFAITNDGRRALAEEAPPSDDGPE